MPLGESKVRQDSRLQAYPLVMQKWEGWQGNRAHSLRLTASTEGGLDLLRVQDREGEDPRQALALVQMHEGEQSLALRVGLGAKGADKGEQDR